MTHLKGRCSCGRFMHFPKWAGEGYQWRCKSCGTVWVLSDKGDPLQRTHSKPPRRHKQRRSHKQRAPGPPEGCLGGLILLLGTLAISAWDRFQMMLSSVLNFVTQADKRLVKEIEQMGVNRDGVAVGDGGGDVDGGDADFAGDCGNPTESNSE